MFYLDEAENDCLIRSTNDTVFANCHCSETVMQIILKPQLNFSGQIIANTSKCEH